MPDKPVLARLEIPVQTLLLYERMVIKGPDHTGNWRFLFDQNGYFFHSRNTQLWLTEESQFYDDDPALFWNIPFPDTPDRCLSEAQTAELMDAIRKADFTTLEEYYASSSMRWVSSPWVERWTVVENNETFTVMIEQGAVPSRLVELRTKIDQLVAESLKPSSP